MTPASPIADLSYRNYDGPLAPTNMRWWVIAKTTMRAALKKRSLWVFMSFSAWYFAVMVIVLYFLDTFQGASAPGQPNMSAAFLGRILWKDQFVHGFSYGQIWVLIITLLVGAGSIANDNRSNALLVYLSKPCTKLDYLFGKFVGVFLMVLMVTAIPALLFYAYGALTYRQEGFFYQDYWVLPKLLTMLVIGAALHSSLIIGFSSMFNQGRLAGATYAGIYFVSSFFTLLMFVLYMSADEGSEAHPTRMPEAAHNLTGTLSYFSIDGLNIAMSRAVMGSGGTAPFGAPGRSQLVPSPALVPTLITVFAIMAISLFIAWRRIRAVEVIG